MKNALKKAILTLLATVMVFGTALLAGVVGIDLPEFNLFGTKVEAEEAPTSGSCGGNLTWTFDKATGELTISGTGEMTSYWSYYDKAPWYDQRSFVKTITLPEGLISIGGYAFYDFKNITSITIPAGVKRIGNNAFSGCESLKDVYYSGDLAGWCGIVVDRYHDGNPMYHAENLYINGVLLEGDIVIPDSITQIYNGTFYNCWGLTGVTISNNVTSIGERAFSGCSNLVSVTIPDGVTSIGHRAFYGCSSLTSITIPDSVTTEICSLTFSGCSSLKSVVIGNRVTGISAWAFQYCSSLESVKMGNSVTYICESAFSGCYNLSSITIPDSVTSIGKYAFSDCSRINISIPDGVTSIGERAFSGCSSLESVTIPDGITAIGDYTFNGCTSLTNIKISNSVTSIGEYAFYECSSLTSIKIPDSVTSIGEKAFSGCSSLESVTISAGVTQIGNYAFSGCSSLKTVTISAGVTQIGNYAFSGCSSLEEVYYTGELAGWCGIDFTTYCSNPVHCAEKLYINGVLFGGDITIPDSVTEIGDWTFYGCSSLESVTIPNSVTSIGEEAFCNCSSLKIVTIPDSVTSIGRWAFIGCSSLESITIPDGVTNIGEGMFSGCSSLTSIIIPDSVTSIGYGVFRDCSSLERVTIPDSVTSIGEEAFYNCSSLKSVTIPDSLTSIGRWAFRGCSSLESITIPDGVTDIGEGIFYGCSSLTNIIIPESVTNIGYGTFYECSSLTSITIPDGVTSIGECIFYGCSSLTSITIPDSVTSIGGGMFSGCSSLTSIIIPESVTNIGGSAFIGCSSLTSIIIPDSVESIGDYAFQNCSELETVTIGNGIKNIGGSAFSGCTSLTSVTFGKSSKLTSIGWGAFRGCSSLVSITIPDGVTSIGEYAFYECTNLESVTIPDSVTSIGNAAFYYCERLTIYYYGTPEQWEKITIGPNYNHFISKIVFECNSERPYYGAGVCGENVIWKLCSDGELIISGTGEMPDWLYVDRPWYDYCSLVKTVTISDGITNIGDRICCYFKNLTTINIPDSVTCIGEEAFYDCSSLESVTIPNSVTSIGDNAFRQCTGLKNITIPDSVVTIGNYAFAFTTLTSVIIPDGVTSIGNGAFYECDSLETVTIGNSVTSIGNDAFRSCNNLTSITIPAAVTSIGENAFYFCISLTSITVDPENTAYSSDEYGVLFNKAKTELIKYPTGNTRTSYVIPDGVTRISNAAFDYCKKLTNITIPDGVTSIGEAAFCLCVNLESLIIPDGMTYIGSEAFAGCYNLKSIVIPDSVTSIGEYAFAQCMAMEYIHIPSRVTTIGNNIIISDADKAGFVENIKTDLENASEDDIDFYAEMGITKESVANWSPTTLICSDSENSAAKTFAEENGNQFEVCVGHNSTDEIVSGTCGENLTWILNLTSGQFVVSGTGDMHDFAYSETPWYSYCSDIRTIEICYGVTRIGKESFYGCNNVENVTIGKSVTEIGLGAFAACTNLKSIEIPDAVTKINDLAFNGCSSLESINFGNSLTYISDYVFAGCENITDVYYNGTETEWNEIEIIDKGNDSVLNANIHFAYYYVTWIIDDEVSTEKVMVGSKITKPEIKEKEGYTVIGWDEPVPEAMPAENLEFTAVYEANPYTVKWIIDGMVISETHKFGEKMDKSKSFEKQGYTFIGWTPEIPETMPAYDLEFTAIFEINISDAVFNANGGMFPDGDLVKRIATEQNAEIVVPENPERAGYQFAGWAYNGKNIGADVGIMDSTEGKIFDAVWIPNEKTAYKVETYTMNTYGEYEVSSMLVKAFVSEEVSVDYTASEGFEINEEKSVLSGTVTSEEMLVLKVYIDRKQYKLTTVVLDTETTVLYYYGSVVADPERPTVDGYLFYWWEPSVPVIMPNHDVTVTARLEKYEIPRIEMVTPEKRTIYYGESITLQVRTYDMPSYARIKWEVSGDGVSIKPSSSGKTCKVTSTSNGNVVIRAYVVDSKGNTIRGDDLKPVYDFEYLYSEVNLWLIIVNFIRQLFGKSDIVSQMFNVLY